MKTIPGLFQNLYNKSFALTLMFFLLGDCIRREYHIKKMI